MDREAEKYCNKCGLTTKHEFQEEIEGDVYTKIEVCTVCGEIDVDCDSADMYYDLYCEYEYQTPKSNSLLKRLKYAIYDWFAESRFLDKVEDKLIYSRFEKISKIGGKFWGFRRGL